MQMIEAIVKPHKLDAVKTALAKLGILGVTALECKGFGRQMGHTERYRGAKMDVGFVPKVLLKICVKSEETEKAITPSLKRRVREKWATGRSLYIPWPKSFASERANAMNKLCSDSSNRCRTGS